MAKINSRSKGIRGELEVCQLMRRWFPDTHRLGEIQRSKVNLCPDIGGEIEKYFYVEVKRYKKITDGMLVKMFIKMLDDFRQHHSSGQPIMIYRQDKNKWFVMPTPDLKEFLSGNFITPTLSSTSGKMIIYTWQDFSDAMDKKFEIKETK